jgi:peptidoglycan hydrolase FlgJ
MSTPIKPTLLAAAGQTQTRTQEPKTDVAELKETARQFESLLTKMMLKSMRDANKGFGDSLFGSSQQDMYQDMFDDQLALQLAGGRGLGLAELMVQQLARTTLREPAPAAVTSQAAAATNVAVLGSRQATAKESFVHSLLPLAREAGQALGVDPHALLAQAALETGWGKSVPVTASGASSFNLFGIKAGSDWTGATVNVPTLEFDAGIPVRKVERFRAYESAQASFRDYAGLIGNNPRYAAAVDRGADVAAFASALQEGGYATDPAYAQKVTTVATEVRGIAAGESFKSAGNLPLQRMARKSS